MSVINKHIVYIKPRSKWRNDETRSLLKSWKNNVHLTRFSKRTKNKIPVYYAMYRDLRKYGFLRSTKEILCRISNLTRNYRKAKKSGNNEKQFFYYKEVDEILKMEDEIWAEKLAREPKPLEDTLQNDLILDELYNACPENTSEISSNGQVIQLSVPEDQQVIPELNLPYAVINHVEAEAPKEPEVIHFTLPQSSTTNGYQKVSENILKDFLIEFERSNKQLEQNDAVMLELFKEQNDIFRTQTTLLMKLLLK